jgi:hypothetical protein
MPQLTPLPLRQPQPSKSMYVRHIAGFVPLKNGDELKSAAPH